MIKKILLFTITMVISFTSVISYSFLTKRMSKVILPQIPSISFSDLIKFSRFSLDKAPSNSLVGVITTMSGEVLYESRMATESAVITKSQEIQQGESVSTGNDGKLIINFKDAVEIILEDNSGVNIIQTLPANLVFKQTLGFVTYKKIGTYPVSIRVGHLLIENKGEIKISFTKDSPITTILIINGSATIAYNNLNNVSKVVKLEAGQSLQFNEGNRQVVTK